MLQTPKHSDDTEVRPLPSKKSRNWVKPILIAVGLLIVASMLLGIVSNLSPNRLTGEAATQDITTDSSSKANSSTGGAAYPAATTAAAAAATTAASSAKSSAPAAVSQSNSSNVNPIANNAPSDRMIIRNAAISLQADDVEKFLGSVRALADEQSGVVLQASTNTRNDKVYANITLQVPSPAFDSTISRLRQLAYKVESETTSGQDVTEEFVDVDAQVRNLKATEAAYLELLKKATSVNDTLTIQRELSSVRGEIERRQGRMNFLQKKSDNSTISLTISPRITDAPKPPVEGWDAGKVLAQAWEGSLKGLQRLATVLITVGVYSWWILPLLLLVFFVARFGWKRYRRTPPAQGATS